VINKKAKIYRNCQIFKSNIDAYSYIAPNSSIVFSKIGKFCSIGKDTSIGLGKHTINTISSSPIFYSKKNAIRISWTSKINSEEFNEVIIGNDVWIGTKAIIMGGITIGNGVIIGAGSIVTKDLPDYSIAVGIPAKVIKYRFDKPIIDKLKEINWWDLPEEKLKEKIRLFQIENFTIDDLNKFNI
jgi:acetyltransferase-like isoleucine patch superfamily enzyme